jgi:hypothetical protein
MPRSRPPVPLVLGVGLGCILLLAGVQSATPGLRPDDGDLEVGGAGRNTTCAVNGTQGGQCFIVSASLTSFLLHGERNLDYSLENMNPCIVGSQSSGFGVNPKF